MAGSQFLYNPEILEIVEARTKEVVTGLSKVLFYPFIYKAAAKTGLGIPGIAVMCPGNDTDTKAIVRVTYLTLW